MGGRRETPPGGRSPSLWYLLSLGTCPLLPPQPPPVLMAYIPSTSTQASLLSHGPHVSHSTSNPFFLLGPLI